MFAWCSRKRLIALVLVVLLLGGLTACLGRSAALRWYYVHQLTRATAAEQALWADRAASLGEPVVPSLLDCLHRHDPMVCDNARAALERLADGWGVNDPRQAALMNQLTETFAQLSPPGQCTALELEARWLRASPAAPGWKSCAARLLTFGSRTTDTEVRRRTLALAAVWLQMPSHAEAVAACRELAQACLKDADANNRSEAVRLAVHADIGLARLVAPLLDDPAPQVRKAAMVAIGPSEEAIATDDLLHSLHDADAEVRLTCEAALRSRGLVGNRDMALARLISDPEPGTRLQVLDRLRRATDLEPGVWLRRLTQDPAPAVRAAAVRAAAGMEDIDFRERLQTMAQQDPSSTVRQLAEHYLKVHTALQQQKIER